MDPGFIRRARDAQNPHRETMRIEPFGSNAVEVIGIVRERAQPDLAKRFRLERNSLGYSQLVQKIGEADPIQYTVIVDELAADPAAVDFFSYTFLSPNNKFSREFRKGAAIQVKLRPVDVIGVGRFWKATDMERLF
jgi:hypothetical protein